MKSTELQQGPSVDFIDQFPLPVWIVNAQTLQIVFYNRTALDLYGYVEAEMSSFNFSDLHTNESKLLFFKNNCRNGNASKFNGIYQHFKKDKTAFEVELFASSLKIESTNYYQFAIVPSEIDTKPKKGIHISQVPEKTILPDKIRENRFLALLVEQTSDILTSADMDFKPLSWNKAAEKIYGITAEEAIGNDIRTYVTINYLEYTREEVRSIIKREGEWKGEVNFYRPTDNRLVHLLLTFKLLKDENENALGVLISGVDITERKEAEQRIRESENRFREMADSAPVMIWISDIVNKITYVNRSWVSWTGVDLAKIKNVGWVDLLHPEDIKDAKKKFDMHFAARLPVTLIYRLRQKNGAYRWVQENGKPRILDNGTFIGYIGSVIDIHDQKQKEELLHEQAIVLENVSDIIVTTDLDFKVQSWNKVAEKYYEIEASDAIGRPMSELVPFNYEGISSTEAAKIVKEKGIWKGNVSFINKSGQTFYFLHTVQYRYDHRSNKIGFISTGSDITEIKKAEEKVEASEKFYRTLIADSLDATLLMTETGQITFISPSVKHILGYEVDDLIDKNGFDFVHPDDVALALDSFQREVSGEPEIKFIIIRLLKKNGEWLWCMVRGHNMLNNPHVKSIVVFFHDDTPRKKANDALMASEKRFRDLIRELQIGIILLNKDQQIILCNASFAHLTMSSESELIGRNIFEIGRDPIHENGKPYKLEERPTFRTLTNKKATKDVVIGILQPKTGSRIWLLINADPILDENGEIFQIICSVKDITERKRMEEEILSKQISHQKQLTQATLDGQEKERTEIGKELHDNIGQQLTTIKLFLDMAKSTADTTTNEMISMALKGVSDVINEVRSMSRSLVPSTLKDLGLVESVNELTDSILRTLKLRIDFNHEALMEHLLQENQKLTLFRIIQEQLNNIVKHSGATHACISLANDDKIVTLQIKDNGRGFDALKVRKGIGFMNIKNRAELFGGSAEVISKPGEGCLVRVTFPHLTILGVI